MALTDPSTPGMDTPQDPNATPNPTTTTSPDPKGTFQDRVNQLTRRASDAERAVSVSTAENAEMKEQMSRLESQIANLSSRPAPPALGEAPDFSGKPKPGSNDAMIQQITENILGVVGPVISKVQEDTANTQLAAKQLASFNAAAQVHPDLNDPKSELHQTFAHLWNKRPDLHSVDGAPELLVEASKGLLSEARANDQVRKMAAAATTPNAPRPIDQLEEDVEINDTLNALTSEGKKEGWTNEDFDDFLTLRFKKFGKTGK